MFHTISILDIFSLKWKLVGLLAPLIYLGVLLFPTNSVYMATVRTAMLCGLLAISMHHAGPIRASLKLSYYVLVIFWLVFWISTLDFIGGHVFCPMDYKSREYLDIEIERRLELSSNKGGKRWGRSHDGIWTTTSAFFQRPICIYVFEILLYSYDKDSFKIYAILAFFFLLTKEFY